MIELHISVRPHSGDARALRSWFDEQYLPALQAQEGFKSAQLLEVYGPAERDTIGATAPATPTLLVLEFASEKLRAAWQASPEHAVVWSALLELAAFDRHVAWDVFANGSQA